MPGDAYDVMATLLELPTQDREAALGQMCEGDPSLEAEVRELLDIDAGATGFLEPKTVAFEQVAPLAQPAAIGPYRILERVGEGGFGIVYSAEQTAPIKRRVALKVIKPGMDTDAVLKRFELERQSLARIEHPNVARVLDGGVVPEGEPGAGRPFFAMEFVEGLPVTRYAESRGLGVEARIGLVLQACAAAQHAHSKGIIHRDLKPSNILVAEVDGEPVCKVIDFGIAKALGEDRPDVTAFTSPGAMVGTPQYMSPEQSVGSADVDIRSDVYSLGVVLYELLSGTTPFDLREMRTPDLQRLRDLIARIEPPAPSSRIAERSDEKSAERTRSREATTAAKRVRGELDWITMRAMAKEPDRRYATVAALADDLRRFLRSEPVEAGPPSVAYKLSKFVKRNRVGVLAASAVSLAVVLGLAGTSVGIVQARAAERDARGAEEEARLAQLDAEASAEQSAEDAAIAEAIIDFLLDDLLSAAEPGRAESRNITVRDALGIAADNVETRFGDRPAVEGRVRNALGRTLEQIGEFQDAEPQRRRELAIYVELEGEAGTRATHAMHALASNLMNQGRFPEAIEISERGYGILRATREPTDPQILQVVTNLGTAYMQIGRMDKGIPLLEEGLRLKRETLGDAHVSTLASAHNLAGALAMQSRWDGAERLAREAYEGRRELLGVGAPATFNSLNLLAWVLSSADRIDEIEALFAESLPIAEERLGPSHKITLMLNRMRAMMLLRADRPAEAEAVFRDVISRYEPDDPAMRLDHVGVVSDLAVAIMSQDRHAEAVAELEAVRSSHAEVLGEQPRVNALYLFWLGQALSGSGRHAEASEALLACLEFSRSATVEVDPPASRVLEVLAENAQDWHEAEPGAGHDAEAARYREQAEAARTATPEPEDPS